MPHTKTAGIHHVTAFAGNAQSNVDFYAGVLGLRLVKKTVNFDAPEVYHLYFGDEVGNPGTAMTFFPFDAGRRGRIGGGQVGYTSFVIPEGTTEFWTARLNAFDVPYEEHTRFNETVIRFADPDGLQFELVERQEGPASEWSFGGIPAEKAIKGFGGALLYSTAPQQTMEVLEELMGLERVGEERGIVRFKAYGDLGDVIDVVKTAVPQGHGGSGTVHHIAWRTKDLTEQEEWLKRVNQAGYHSSTILDRNYFSSIYFREDGGILFEIATDEPGFLQDESFETLGTDLKLPTWLEPHREQITRGLGELHVRELEEGK